MGGQSKEPDLSYISSARVPYSNGIHLLCTNQHTLHPRACHKNRPGELL